MLTRFIGPAALALAATLGCSSDDTKSTEGDGGNGGGAEETPIDRSSYTDVGKDPLDYSDANLWLG